MDDLKVALHIFASVLALGTGWRMASYHLLASPNTHLKHFGSAMSVQY